MKYILVGDKDRVKVPRQMPNNDFTKSYSSVTEATESITNAALVGNFFLNLVLSGAMTFLWGMLNCM